MSTVYHDGMLDLMSSIEQWLKKLRQSREVSSALGELGRLAANHHQAVGAVTLNAVNKMMGILVEGSTGELDDDFDGTTE